ncbi:hypothetical protein DFH07DRAFT_773197 [Mycena maculata]|uniref:Uncharacterized protein n=1 Tax=Mycena maculata TaxID=230809 RepID=A0AAD7J756_9AGAR|nr:hypothetical protein DFH07DRAFT_773197 [Mycena maculata]
MRASPHASPCVEVPTRQSLRASLRVGVPACKSPCARPCAAVPAVQTPRAVRSRHSHTAEILHVQDLRTRSPPYTRSESSAIVSHLHALTDEAFDSWQTHPLQLPWVPHRAQGPASRAPNLDRVSIEGPHGQPPRAHPHMHVPARPSLRKPHGANPAWASPPRPSPHTGSYVTIPAWASLLASPRTPCNNILVQIHASAFSFGQDSGKGSSLLAFVLMPPPLERALTPLLPPYSEDAAVFQDEAFAMVFEEHAAATRTRRNGRELQQKLADVLSEPHWVQFQNDWLDFTLGGEIVGLIPGDVVERCQQLFIDVLWTRYSTTGSQDGETQALDLLLEVQMKSLKDFRPFAQPPADFCWLEDIQQRTTYDGDSDAGERNSDWEDVESNLDEELNSLDLDPVLGIGAIFTSFSLYALFAWLKTMITSAFAVILTGGSIPDQRLTPNDWC